MSRSFLRHLRRCRLLFVLALCAWLGLAGSVSAHADCCVGMDGMATATAHRDGTPPLHAGGMHADCACAHVTAALPEPAASVVTVRLAAMTWRAWPSVASELPRTPPLRPPLA
jgi:hypothetical protein